MDTNIIEYQNSLSAKTSGLSYVHKSVPPLMSMWLIVSGVPLLRHQIIMQNKTKIESDWLGRLIKSPIFVVQMAAAPKNGVEFRQKFIWAISCSVATSYDKIRHRATQVPLSTNQKFVVVGGWWWWEYKPILVIGFSQTKSQADQLITIKARASGGDKSSVNYKRTLNLLRPFNL